jgi:hypothetical protein
MAKGKVTPSVLVNTIRENQNNNKSLKALFSSQFLGKFSVEELEALKRSIDKDLKKREGRVIQEKINFLEMHGFKVQKT